MKKGLIAFALVFVSHFTYGQFSFGVSPGLSLNGAYFGYQIKENFVPFVSFQFLRGNIALESTGREFDWDLMQMVDYSYTANSSAGIYLPSVGLKYFFKNHNKLKAYGSLAITKPILSVSQEIDGDEDEALKEYVDGISLWGGEIGFGIEYFFDENFSLGGEFGIRYLNLSIEETYKSTVYNPNTGLDESANFEDSFSYSLNPSYTKISLNYYF